MAAIDIGQALGLEVVACASSDEKLAACSAAGASTLVRYGDDAASGDFKTALQNACLCVCVSVSVCLCVCVSVCLCVCVCCWCNCCFYSSRDDWLMCCRSSTTTTC